MWYKKIKKRELKTKSKQLDNEINYAYIAAKAAEDKKGGNILLLDVSRLTIIADYFLIITAKSTAQIEAIANNIIEKLKNHNYRLLSKEGFSLSNWLVLDFGNLIVHIMNQKERDYYKLERSWSNATLVNNKLWEKAS